MDFYFRNTLFDLLNLEGSDLRGLPLAQRRACLRALVRKATGQLRFSDALNSSASEVIRAVKQQGLEGVVAKRADSIYEPGVRSGAWVKYKTFKEQEFVVGGYRLGSDCQDLECLLVGYYEGQKLRFAAKVKGGFSPESKEYLLRQFRGLVIKTCPFVPAPRCKGPGLEQSNRFSAEELRKCVWLKSKVIVQVGFTEWTEGGHLRHSIFKGPREDKVAREVVREAPR